MHFSAIATFLAISSVSGLVVPNAQNAVNTDIPEAITTTWVGVKNSTGVFPGATTSKRSVLDLGSPVIDEDVALALSRRAGLILAKRTIITTLLTSFATGAAAEAGKLAVDAAAAQVRNIINWTAAREAFTKATTRAMWERNPDYAEYVAAVCYNQDYGLSDPAAMREGVVSVSLVSGVLETDYDSCRQYAVQQGLLPSSAELSKLSRFAICLEAVLVQRPAQANSKPIRTAAAFNTKKPPNLLALFIQLSGQESKQSCRTCRQGHGRWDGCVVCSQPEVQRFTEGACANCYYNGLGSKCSFRQNSPVRAREYRPRDVSPPVTLPIQFPKECIEWLRVDESATARAERLRIKVDLILGQLSNLNREIFVLEILHSAQGEDHEKDITSLQEIGNFLDYAHVFELFKANPDMYQSHKDALKREIDWQAERLASFLSLKKYLASSTLAPWNPQS
ncbi:hypothetical protein Daus18300_014406 [Diaporthe australafricana]|uniref:DUF7888 domain-containing protein n=1 Tax=Diaporthe australafricana TaxID=127596 RepID=A0ABR3VVC8_9PEZI